MLCLVEKKTGLFFVCVCVCRGALLSQFLFCVCARSRTVICHRAITSDSVKCAPLFCVFSEGLGLELYNREASSFATEYVNAEKA